jgi:2'-5' RNA ligase
MSSKRLFLAIAIPPDFRSQLASYKHHIALERLSWVKEENLHITLLFLGNIDIENIPTVEKKLASLTDFKPFHLTCTRVIPVCRRGKLSMIWASFEESPDFTELATRVSDILHHPSDHPPLPHVTLARARRGHSVKPDKDQLPIDASFSWQVQKFGLWESVLGPQGTTYTMLKEWKLGGC